MKFIGSGTRSEVACIDAPRIATPDGHLLCLARRVAARVVGRRTTKDMP
jgi:hypothetical protein